MMRPIALLFCLPLLLAGADFWTVKKPADWSEKEAKRILSNSPWARETTMSLGMGGRPGMGGGSIPDASSGGPPTGGRGGGGGGGGRGGGGGMPEGPPPAPTVVVRWDSSTPVREALARLEMADPIPAEMREILRDYYVVTVAGFPIRGGPNTDLARLQQRLSTAAALTVKGREPVPAAGARLIPQEKSISIQYIFPRAAAFSPTDKEVRFQFKMGSMEFNSRFRLKDMVFDGNLAL